jgi:hypothetical protein
MKKMSGYILLSSLIAWFFISFTHAYMPKLEGKLFPVAWATGYELTKGNTPQLTRIDGVMHKSRSCTFKKMEAFLVDDEGDRVQAIINVKESIKLRKIGKWKWGTWEIAMPLWQASDRLLIVTTHRCHPLWLTETVFLDTRVPL